MACKSGYCVDESGQRVTLEDGTGGKGLDTNASSGTSAAGAGGNGASGGTEVVAGSSGTGGIAGDGVAGNGGNEASGGTEVIAGNGGTHGIAGDGGAGNGGNGASGGTEVITGNDCAALDRYACEQAPECWPVLGAPVQDICADNYSTWMSVLIECATDMLCGDAETYGEDPLTGNLLLHF